jgi:glycosyltransferase involved in cell wall biosynthesis
VCGERFSQWPAIFDKARSALGDRVEVFGFVPDRNGYETILSRAHIVVSTAHHEFFGVSMIEATHHGAYPLVPDRLVYPEVFDAGHRYADDAELVARLEVMCRSFAAGEDSLRADRRSITDRFSAATVVPAYERCFAALVPTRG